MGKVAVVGGGIAGISAAYVLRDHADVTIFESEHNVGGHANTIEVSDPTLGVTLGLDTGFIIYNDASYPEFSGFLRELGVSSDAHRGGFFSFDVDSGIQFGTAEMDLSEAEVASRFPAEFVDVWSQARRFHQEAPRDFLRKQAEMPLGEYLSQHGYTREFAEGFVVQLATAVWSMPPRVLWRMPAATFIAFFMAHDAEGLGGRTVEWKTVSGGSISYVRRAIEAIAPTIRLGETVTSLRGVGDHVVVETSTAQEVFDAVVLATHADEALRILVEPTPAQQAINVVEYNMTDCVLHTDPVPVHGCLERLGSWNFGAGTFDGVRHTWPIYYLNKLQGLSATEDYFVTIDYPGHIDPERVIRRFNYSHPILTVAVRDLQRTVYDAHEDTRVFLAGSYMHSKRLGPDQIGSHEAAFSSGAVAGRRALGVLRGG